MEVVLAKKLGFCFGVKRAISIAEQNINAQTFGPLIHNKKEIDRLKRNFYVDSVDDIENLDSDRKIIIRTHGIAKGDFQTLKDKNSEIIDATCPFVTKPQKICEEMSGCGYDIVIFGDISHPEVKGVMSYSKKEPIVILDVEELKDKKVGDRVALVSQTTRRVEKFLEVANLLIKRSSEVRVFNTICNATFDNQDAVKELAQSCDIVIIIGGKNSSNTKQLLKIAKNYCHSCYLIEDENELLKEWFEDKKMCGISAGASTPEWIIDSVVGKIKDY